MPSHDVLIIGAGLAGQRAALEAAKAGASVAILSKVHPVRSHSVAAAGGINAAVKVTDSWESHAYDTVKGSDFLGDQDAIEVMCREAPEEVLHLEHIGVTFHRNEDGQLDARAFGGASAKRTFYVADITGQAILHVLYEQLTKYSDQIDKYEEWFSTSLIQNEDGSCGGCIARDIRTGRMEVFNAKSTILANGGAGQIFKPTTNALICTADGMAQAFDIGAELMDMEMIQYHPTTLVSNGFLITEGARGEGAHLINGNGERFMSKYAPNKLELASRDVVSRAEQTEINEGRGAGPNKDGIWLDITVVPKKRVLEALREIVNIGKDFSGVDITKEPILIRPGQHYIMGGVRTNVDGQVPNVPGLYAAGEVACVSVHGGNRLGANSLLDTLIFGKRSGAHAAARASDIPMPSAPVSRLEQDVKKLDKIIGRERTGRRVSEIKDELGTSMNRNCAVYRTQSELEEQLEIVRRLKEEAKTAAIDDKGTIFNQDVLGALELEYMVKTAETIVLGAIERKESRGAQSRADFPDRDDANFLKHFTFTDSDTGPVLGEAPITFTQWEPEVRSY
jgi:succinate dehydrogenase / fumarate reductase flavoprotein subunit